jgi:hypothetical protein
LTDSCEQYLYRIRSRKKETNINSWEDSLMLSSLRTVAAEDKKPGSFHSMCWALSW